MIKYPNSNKRIVRRDNTLKGAVNAGAVRVGQRFFVGNNPVTCVHIDGDKYIFSMDDIFKKTSHDKIAEVLETIWTTGMIDGVNVIPTDIMSDIDFLFVPTERQVFGKNEYGVEEDDEQFEWFKRGDFTRVKGYQGSDKNYEKGDTCTWWLATVYSGYSTHYCYVYAGGYANYGIASYIHIGVPVFFQMTRKENN